MLEPTDPRGRDGGRPAVRVEYVHRDAPPIQVILLTDPRGLLVHFAKPTSRPCYAPEACPSRWHNLRARWHGYSAVLLLVNKHPVIWEHRVLDVSAGFARALEGRPVRGERWQLAAPKNASGQNPVVAQHLGVVELPADLEPCNVEAELLRIFDVHVLPPHRPNPIPSHQYLAPVQLHDTPEEPVVRPAVYVPPPPPPVVEDELPSLEAIAKLRETLPRVAQRMETRRAELLRARANGTH